MLRPGVGVPRLRYCFEEECADYDEARQTLGDVKGTNASLVRGGGVEGESMTSSTSLFDAIMCSCFGDGTRYKAVNVQ